MKTIDTLIHDIDNIFLNKDHKVSDVNLKLFCDNLANVVKDHIEQAGNRKQTKLRMSNLGLPDRQLYFDVNTESEKKVNPELERRFLMGHVVEHLLLFLAREAGHKVTHEQMTVSVDGVEGHTDCAIDDVPTDAKSVSPYQTGKFKSKEALKENDGYGYITQIAGYREALKGDSTIDQSRAMILAQDKSSGDLYPVIFDKSELPDVPERIAYVKAMLAKPEPPKKLCYEPVSKGKGGNEVLNVGCKFCPHKFRCFPDLRVFNYSNGYEYFTKVLSEPIVPEVKSFGKKTAEEDFYA